SWPGGRVHASFRAYDPGNGRRAPFASTRSPSPAPTAWAKRHARRMAGMAPPAARLLARAAISRRLVWAWPMGRPVELVGRPMVLGSGAARHRRYYLLRNLGLINWISGDVLWPLLLILLGVWLLVRRGRGWW